MLCIFTSTTSPVLGLRDDIYACRTGWFYHISSPLAERPSISIIYHLHWQNDQVLVSYKKAKYMSKLACSGESQQSKAFLWTYIQDVIVFCIFTNSEEWVLYSGEAVSDARCPWLIQSYVIPQLEMSYI
jgi:hypothetical protein